MKLRNKKTGETIDVVVNPTDFNTMRLCRVNIVKSLQAVNTWEYNSLAELNEEWEDASEEPKIFYYITGDGYVVKENDTITKDFADDLESIGNYFVTKEEAEKAAEKLKAWKRLKDAGFKFIGEGVGLHTLRYTYKGEWCLIAKDFDLLFGGEE